MKFKNLIASAIPFIFLACAEKNKIPPEEAAKKYMNDLGYHNVGVSCTQTFDDQTKPYVWCTTSLNRGDDFSPLIIVIHCAPLGETTGGCWMSQNYMNALMQTKIILHKEDK